MLWVLKRTVSMRRFFWAPKTYVKIDGLENIYNFTLKIFVYLNLCSYNMHTEEFKTHVISSERVYCYIFSVLSGEIFTATAQSIIFSISNRVERLRRLQACLDLLFSEGACNN